MDAETQSENSLRQEEERKKQKIQNKRNIQMKVSISKSTHIYTTSPQCGRTFSYRSLSLQLSTVQIDTEDSKIHERDLYNK